MVSASKMILAGISIDPGFSSKVRPYLKDEYFDHAEKIVYNIIDWFIKKYNCLPTKEAVVIDLDSKELKKEIFDECLTVIDEVFSFDIKGTDKQYVLETAEKYCKDCAIQLALIESVEIADKISNDERHRLSETSIPDILLKAVSVSFDNSIGMDYIDDAEERFERYLSVEDKISFSIDNLNDSTNGGFVKKSLNIFMAGTGVGKTLTMCSLAADNLLNAKNVLYVTLEIDDNSVAKRIDSNLLDIDMKDIIYIGKTNYLSNIEKVRNKTIGKIIIYEDSSGNFNSIKLQSLLDNLKLKKGFVPDVVYVDYIGLCKSSVHKESATPNHIYLKKVSEELRNVAKQYNFALTTAVQMNREGFGDSDAGLKSIADSFGLSNTADWIGIILRSDDLDRLKQYEIKEVKTRYNSFLSRFFVGVDKDRMKLYNLANVNSNNQGFADREELTSRIRNISSSSDFDSLDYED